ncbi:MAG: ribonuclease P protein component [Anaerolinea sp.]|nr:ribonuclease P protein component [Anaerolinea sp.]
MWMQCGAHARRSSQGELEARVKRRFRLTRSADFQGVRRSGKSYAHPLVVLFVLASDAPAVRVGVAAGLRVGNAVRRNRAKRLLRAAMQNVHRKIVPGFDLLLIARQPLPFANLSQTQEALSALLTRAGLLSPTHGD